MLFSVAFLPTFLGMFPASVLALKFSLGREVLNYQVKHKRESACGDEELGDLLYCSADGCSGSQKHNCGLL